MARLALKCAPLLSCRVAAGGDAPFRSIAQVEQAFRFFDQDGGGQIEKNGAAHVESAVLASRNPPPDVSLLTEFSATDRQYLSDPSPEFKSMMLELGDPLTEAEIDSFFAAVDVDNDGCMSYDEFVGALRETSGGVSPPPLGLQRSASKVSQRLASVRRVPPQRHG